MSQSKLFFFALALLALRIGIGFHFFVEGTTKLKNGDFQASGFLNAARGPLAPFFHSFLDDPAGQKKLSVRVDTNDGAAKILIDPTLTLAIWDDFVDVAGTYYRFGDEQLRQQLAERIKSENESLEKSQKADAVTSIEADHSQISSDRASLKQLEQQRVSAKRILEQHKRQLLDWIDEHRTELIAHFSTADRLDGFRKDGKAYQRIALEVESLRGQVDKIRADRAAKLIQWSAEVVSIWDSFEQQINGLAVDQQKSKAPLVLHRPFDQPNSKLKWINRVIPWFDTVVGVCLILGFFTRSAAFAAAAFLLSIILTQPFWVPGSISTSYQIVEFVGLLVVAASSSGRIAGLDTFLVRRRRSAAPPSAQTTQPT